MNKVNLAEKFSLFAEPWSPRIVGELNDHQVKLVKLRGEFVWHSHPSEDEMFLVVRGAFTMRYRDCDVPVGEGEFVIVPRGTEHMPAAAEECWVMLVEPRATVNTGDSPGPRTVESPGRL